jgi:superfamily II DNA or RNA helicase
MQYNSHNYIYSLIHPFAYTHMGNHHQKFGMAKNLISRNCAHNTSHLFRAQYKWILLITNETNAKAEQLLQEEFIDKHLYFDAGNEFYDGSITLDDVKALYDENGIEYDDVDINDLPPDEYYDELEDKSIDIYHTCKSFDIHTLKQMISDTANALTTTYTKLNSKYALRDYQQECINIFMNLLKSNEYFQGIYNLATGLGKSVIMWEICMQHLSMYPDDNILLVTFRKDIYYSIKKNFDMSKIIAFVDTKYKKSKVEKAKGKIIIILRQKLVMSNCVIPDNIIHGIVYDECHDGTTVDIATCNTLLNLNESQKLKYRIGFSATPLTESEKQNCGSVKLYGKDQKINYLYTYGIMEGIRNGWLTHFTIDFMNIEANSNIKEFFEQITLDGDHYKQNKSSYLEILTKIKKAMGFSRYRKGILWLNTINAVNMMYNFLKGKLGNINVIHSHSGYNDDDDTFLTAESDYLMIACEKFSTGYDTKNLDVGFNFVISEAGNITVQKLGIFLRLKDLYDKNSSVHFYQLCEINEDASKGRVLGNIVKNIIGVDKCDEQNNVLKKIKAYIKEEDCDDVINIDQFDININIKSMTYDMFKAELNKSLKLSTQTNLSIIKEIVKQENINRRNDDEYIIDNIEDYNLFAEQNDLQKYCDIIKVNENVTPQWLFSIDTSEYVSWHELKKMCKKFNCVGNNPTKWYNDMRCANDGIPKDPSIIYLKDFTNYDDLFDKNADIFSSRNKKVFFT